MFQRKVNSLVNLSLHFWPHRRKFSSQIEFFKATALRVLSARSIRNHLKHRSWALKHGASDQPIYLRVGTEDIIIFEEIFLNEEYGSASDRLISNSCVLDLGGNIGLASKYFAENCFPRLVIAAEPDASNVSLLRMNNIDAIESGRLVVYQCFVSASSGKAAISRNGIQPAGYRMARQEELEQMGGDAEFVDCMTIRDLVERHAIESIDLLKCDIEGAEAELFGDCISWISLVKRLVVETHHPYSPEALLDDLRGAGVTLQVQSIVRRGKFAVVTADISPCD